MSAPTAAQQAAADQALRWSLALAGPGRQFGPSLVPCDEDKRPIKSWEWKHEHAPKYEQSRERLLLAMRHSQFASTWAITPASDGLIVIDVDNMDYLARALEDFGPTPVFMRSRSGKVHLYYQGPPVRSHGNLYGGPREPSVEIKCEGAMIHVAGPGYVPSVPLPPRPWCDVLATRGALRSNVPMFRGERPARGRYRQFYQAGCEVFSSLRLEFQDLGLAHEPCPGFCLDPASAFLACHVTRGVCCGTVAVLSRSEL